MFDTTIPEDMYGGCRLVVDPAEPETAQTNNGFTVCGAIIDGLCLVDRAANTAAAAGEKPAETRPNT